VKKTLLCIALGALTATSAFAAPTTILDTYIGAASGGSSPLTNTQDATSDRYDIESMTANITTSTFTVSIKAKEYTDSFDGNTSYFQSWVSDDTDFWPGDLFISTNGWNPYSTTGAGKGAPAYGKDNKVNGEQWEYAISATDFSGNATSPGSNTIRPLSGVTKLLLTPGTSNSAFNIDSGSIRSGQVGEIDNFYVLSHASLATGGTWTISDSNSNGVLDTMTYVFNNASSAMSIINGQKLGLYWTMSCANDVIQGGVVAVPEPETYGMLLAGLGLVGYRVRRRSAQI
jgi:hypothetical protein